jgi:hypothetical protein
VGTRTPSKYAPFLKDAIMGKLYLCTAWAIALCLSCQTSATVVTFDDLSERKDISGTTRYNIFWEFGNQVSSYTGSWYVPDNPSDPENDYWNFPYSDSRNITNSYGCTQIGFKFPAANFEYGAYVSGAYFAVQGFQNNWAEYVKAIGYKDGEQVWETYRLTLGTTPQWLPMGELAVDRVVIVTTPKEGKANGGFGMDNLTFEKILIPEPMTLALLALGTTALHRRKK